MGGYVTKVDMTKAFRGAVEWLKNAYESAYYVEKDIRDGEPISNVKLFEAIRAERAFLESFAVNQRGLDPDSIGHAKRIVDAISPIRPAGDPLGGSICYGEIHFNKVIDLADQLLRGVLASPGTVAVVNGVVSLQWGNLVILKGLRPLFEAWRSGAHSFRISADTDSNSLKLAHKLKTLLLEGEALGLYVDWERRCPTGSINNEKLIEFGQRTDRAGGR